MKKLLFKRPVLIERQALKKPLIKNHLGLLAFVLLAFTLLIPQLTYAASTNNAASTDNTHIDCDNPKNTLEINECGAIKRDEATRLMRQYLIASYEQYKNDDDSKEIIEAIKKSQRDWQTYADSNCGAVYTSWQSGTIRGIMGINCDIRLIKQRTHELWLNYLTYMDSTPPVLPEPKLSE